jgi:ATP-dependent RNA helicase SUPV3L1/SUV3
VKTSAHPTPSAWNGAAAVGRVHALLGPTNTGKTHRAVERMLDFESGAIGLPLRLLAREVYDRVSERLGEQAVALITGEEKRVPPRARYFICTVEAMPPDLDVEFLAIDEIQLVANPERGHVFTERLLHWRGRVETWFLGADTIESLLREQLEHPTIARLPRLSRLTHAGQHSLRTLPRRSAVVAFGVQQVYELADLLRVRRGGAAVVLGALSPRVRNAQVALYQSGEVDFLVATDAIGMGLNLDIDHVALAADVKFDGFETRGLEDTELAQIVGRAGRYLRDGSFGTLAPLPELTPRMVERLQSHRFAPQRFAYYRNAQLDYASLAALLASLARRPTHPSLRFAPDADDVLTLRVLAKHPDVAALVSEPAHVERVWDVCRIPNYEKRMPEHQAERLLPLLTQLVQRGRLSADYVDSQVKRLERNDGDIHVLLDRLAAVRTWTYVSHQSGWLDDAASWRGRTRTLEDRLSDLLHERLLARFVVARTSPLIAVASRSVRPNEHHAFAKLAQLDTFVDPAREAASSRDAWAERVISGDFGAFKLEPSGEVAFEGQRLARLAPGQSRLRPTLKLTLPDWLHPGARSRVERRLHAHLKDLVAYLFEPLSQVTRTLTGDARESAPLRGLVYQLEQGLGTVLRRQVAPQLEKLSATECTALATWQIELGRQTVFSREMLDAQRSVARAALTAAWERGPGGRSQIDAMPLESPAWPIALGLSRENCLAIGFVMLTRWAVRCDVLELLLNQPNIAARKRTDAAADEVRTLLGCSAADARAILNELPQARRSRRRRSRRGTASQPASDRSE